MASYTDNPQALGTFNPYIQQLPVEEMAMVGMTKQKQYDEGIQRIQASIDNIAGLDVIRGVDRKYLQSKLNQLGNNLRTVAAGDFSNYQLVNSATGMANQIGKDRNVQNAVSSSARYRKEIALMDEDRKNGKLTPDNEFYFSKQANKWLGSNDINEQFNGKYVANFDIFKYAKETFDAIKPDGMSFDQIYQLGADGKPLTTRDGSLILSHTMTRMDKEGIFPQKVKQTLDQIFSDPRVNQQLNITGQYNYRNYTPEDLANKVNSQREQLSANYNTKMTDLYQQKAMGKDVQEEIDSVQAQYQNTLSTYDTLNQTAYNNPDAVRGLLYRDDVNSRYTTMFGWTKSKQQVMENPAWRAQFDIQKEANAQSRWAQDFAQKKIEFAAGQKWKGLEYEQRERFKQMDMELAEKKLTVKGKAKSGEVDAEGRGFEQGDQPADIDVITLQSNNYDKAAKDFTNASNDLLWKTTLSGIPGNEEMLSRVMKNRNIDRDQALSILIRNAAKANKMSTNEFRTAWINKGVTRYENMSPKEKANNPVLADAYATYRQTNRVFRSEYNTKKQIDQEMDMAYPEAAKAVSMEGIKDQKVNLYGKEYNLSKNDIKDLALYLKGHSTIFGYEIDDNVRTMGKAAGKRLEQSGKGDLLDVILRTKGVTTGGPISGLARIAKGTIGNVTDIFRSNAGEDINFDQVMKVYKMLDNKTYANSLTKKAEIIKRNYGINPNMKVGLVTGDAKIDKPMFSDMKRMAGAYASGQKQNLSPDFDNFISSLGKNLEDSNVEATVIMDANNNPQVELVSYDSNGKRVGGMTIQPDEAAKFGVDVNNLYESKEIASLKNDISYNNNKSCHGPIKEKSTYTQGDYVYGKRDIPSLKNTNYDAKVNFRYANGKYYPYVLVSDGQTSDILELEGDPSLSKVDATVKTMITPSLIKQFLIEK